MGRDPGQTLAHSSTAIPPETGLLPGQSAKCKLKIAKSSRLFSQLCIFHF
jgi:hypothetical protein